MRFLFSIFFTCMLSFTFSFAVEGEVLYKKCKGCHGIDGKHVPFERQEGILAGRDKVQIELIMNAIKDGKYTEDQLNKIMRKTINKFSAEEISKVAEYISTFKL